MLEAKIEKLNGLTPREGRVLQAMAEGLTNEAIGDRLAVSIKTVEAHIDHIYDKLQVRSASVNARCAAIVTAVARGMVSVSLRSLCLWLMVSAAGLDCKSDRVGRPQSPMAPRVQMTRVRRVREDA